MRTWIVGALLIVAAACVPAPGQETRPQPQQGRTLRVYHVGNSVTDTINYAALATMAAARGHRHVWGRHMIPGAPLDWIWNHADSGFEQEPFGYYPKALPGFEWDAVTLQPFDRHLAGEDGDVKVASKFIELALKNPANRNTQFYVYSRWPRRPTAPDHAEHAPKYEPLDFADLWSRDYTGAWDNTNETRDYFERLLMALQDAHSSDLAKPILMVPVGDVMLDIDRRMRAGQMRGYTSIEQVYSDGIHLNAVGSFIVGTTFYATLYREDPTGLPGEPYKVDDPALVRAIQSVVWEVVSRHPLAMPAGD